MGKWVSKQVNYPSGAK